MTNHYNDRRTWDQEDYQSLLDALQTEADGLESALKSAHREVPARPVPKTKNDLIESVDLLEAHNAHLRALCSIFTVKDQVPKASAVATQPATPEAQRPLTATERCLAARGKRIASQPTPVYSGVTARCIEARKRQSV